MKDPFQTTTLIWDDTDRFDSRIIVYDGQPILWINSAISIHLTLADILGQWLEANPKTAAAVVETITEDPLIAKRLAVAAAITKFELPVVDEENLF